MQMQTYTAEEQAAAGDGLAPHWSTPARSVSISDLPAHLSSPLNGLLMHIECYFSIQDVLALSLAVN